jgi:hypothetical protein
MRSSAAKFAEITEEFDGVSLSIVNQKVPGSYDLIAQTHPGDAELLGAIPTQKQTRGQRSLGTTSIANDSRSTSRVQLMASSQGGQR